MKLQKIMLKTIILCSVLSIQIVEAKREPVELVATNLIGQFLIPGNQDGSPENVYLSSPANMVSARNGSVYFSDNLINCIKWIRPSGEVKTIAGRFIDNDGDGIADDDLYSTYSDGYGTTALFYHPSGLALNSDESLLYVTDSDNHLIRCIELTNGFRTTTIAGIPRIWGWVDGKVGISLLNDPCGIAVGIDGTIFISDRGNCSIRAIAPNGYIFTLTGSAGRGFVDGDSTVARFDCPNGICITSNNILYVADGYNNSIRQVDTKTGRVVTIAGMGPNGIGWLDGLALSSKFAFPTSLTIHPNGNLIISDYANRSLRIYNGVTVSTLPISTMSDYCSMNPQTGRNSLRETSCVVINTDGTIIVSMSNFNVIVAGKFVTLPLQ